jgi:hypothetical protein
MSNFNDLFVKGSFKVMANSRDAEIVSSMKIQRYMRFDFVGFFFD